MSSGYSNGLGTNALFNYLGCLVLNSAGVLYVSDGNRIRSVAPSGLVSLFAGPVDYVNGYVNGAGSNARFNGIVFLFVNPNGVLYVGANRHIRAISPGGIVTTLAGGGVDGITQGVSGGTGTNALFHDLGAAAVDSAGNLFVRDQFYISPNPPVYKIRVITPGGVVSTLAGGGADGMTNGASNGVGTNALLSYVSSMTIHSSGTLYIVEDTLIRTISPGGIVSTVAGGGIDGTTTGYADGVGTNALFDYPYVSTAVVGGILVYDNQRIRSITPAGVVATIAGGGDGDANADGIGTNAPLNEVLSITFDVDGFAYMASQYSYVAISPGGYVSRIGIYSSHGSAINGIGTNARFNRYAPQLAVNSSGFVYVTDQSSIRVIKRFFCPPGYLCTAPSDVLTITPCPPGYYCTSPVKIDTPVLCPTGSYCPLGASAPIACPANTATLYAGAAALTTCVASTGASAAGSLAAAGSACFFNLTCSSQACRGGHCCSNASASLGCSSCTPSFGSCHLSSPGEPCSSSFDCGSNLCLGKCCCAASALTTSGCTSCRCLSVSGTVGSTAGICTSNSSAVAVTKTSLQCNSSVSINASSVSLSSVISFPASSNVTDSMPLVFLPSTSPLNTYGVDIIVASSKACAAFASNTAGATTCSSTAYSLPDGVYYYLGRAVDLGMTAAPACGA